jgi:hypothetical protein
MFKRRLIAILGLGVVVNCLLFAGYRLIFLARCADPFPFSDIGRVLLHGLRLDVALLGFELCLVGLSVLLLRRLRLSVLFWWLCALTALHGFLCLTNVFAFAERGQNAGDLVLPYITSPYQVYLAVAPFVQQHWLLLAGGVVGVVFGLGLCVRLGRRMEAGVATLDLWGSGRTLAIALILALLPLLMTWEPIVKKKDTAHSKGITLIFANSKYYTHFPDFRVNEAVINPLFEFVGVQVPAALHAKIPYRLTEAEALNRWRQAGNPPLDARYPLLKVVHGREKSSIENVVIIQVEGLSGSLMEQERNGRPVLPYLRKLAQTGLYFPNAFQNANFTSGGVFSTATGVPKAPWEDVTQRFASRERHGYYGSFAHILGTSNYTHSFWEGFRQGGDDFLAFMAYQGCQGFNYRDFQTRLAAKSEQADADSLLGIHDGYLMQECGEMLLQCRTRFTAHLMTCTTHSPWVVPPSFAPVFDDPSLNAFAYLDASIERFITRLTQVTAIRDTTVFIVLGDHTSVTFGNDLLERLRIPLILHAPGLPRLEKAGEIWASQVDVVPTVLGLMQGDHLYSGMGRNLLDRSALFTGIMSGTRDKGFYLTSDWVLEYHPFDGETRLLAVQRHQAKAVAVDADNPAEARRLLTDYLARVELVRRLSSDKRVFPAAVAPVARGLRQRAVEDLPMAPPTLAGTLLPDGRPAQSGAGH